MSNTGIKHVTWVARERAAYVRVPWRRKIHGAAWFYASEHGGKRKAVAAAARHAAKVCRRLGKPITHRVVNATPRNTTGVVGMTIVKRQTDRQGKRFARAVQASWIGKDGKLHRTNRSIKKLGLQEAKRQIAAILARAQRERFGRALPRPVGRGNQALRRKGGKR